MAKNEIWAKVGSLSFLIGILIALIFGIWQAHSIETSAATSFFASSNGGIVAWILAIIGIVIGFLAILGRGTLTTKEIPGFLFAGIALVVMGGVFQSNIILGLKPYIGSLLSGISLSLSIFVAPAVGILALKAIWDMGKEV